MYMQASCCMHYHMTFITHAPLMSFPKPMEEATVWPLLLDFSFRTSSSSLDALSAPCFFFFFLWRGGSFLGNVNMGKMTNSMAKAQRRKPLHLWVQCYALMIITLSFDFLQKIGVSFRNKGAILIILWLEWSYVHTL